MPWDINQINNQFMQTLPQPYTAVQQGADDAFKRQVLQQQAQAAQQQQALALQRQQQKQQMVAAAIAKPSAEAFANLATMFPEDREAFKQSWETRDKEARRVDLSQLSSIRGYLKSGNADKASRLLQSRIDADKAAGQDTQDDELFLEAINSDPAKAAGYADYVISMIPDADKGAGAEKNIAEANTITANKPGVVAEQAAKASKAQTEAQYAPQVIESDLASEAATREKQAADIAQGFQRLKLDTDRLALDRDKLAADTLIRTEDLTRKYGQLPPPAQKLVNDTVISAGVNYGLAERAKSLANQFQATQVSGGWGAAFAEKFKGAFGSQNALTGLRNSYDSLINSQAVKNLPPGPASDKDIQLAKQGFPPSTAGKDHIVSFLRGMEKMQRLAGEADDRKAAWVSANGGLGAAKQDMEVDGYLVKRGTQFNQFNRGIGALGKGPNEGIVALEQQYGGR